MRLGGPKSWLAALLICVALLSAACSKDSGTGQEGAVSFLTFENSLLPEAITPFTTANPT